MEIILLILIILNLGLSFFLLLKSKNQTDVSASLSQQRQELTLNLKTFGESLENRLNRLTDLVGERLETMRVTVDEKLQTSLERRLNESFKQVSERLEAVYKGLGEMQSLTSGVGDLKRVLTNVKTRGTWGEVQLDQLLTQILSQAQYQQNVATKKIPLSELNSRFWFLAKVMTTVYFSFLLMPSFPLKITYAFKRQAKKLI